jgi:hypothetical protein
MEFTIMECKSLGRLQIDAAWLVLKAYMLLGRHKLARLACNTLLS